MNESKILNMSKENITALLDDCWNLKPKDLIIDELKWRYMFWSVLRGKNILFTGPTRCGKTKAAQCISKTLDRPFEPFNLGSTQDARATLIGNTYFDGKKEGTIFNESKFVKMIRTPNSVILLDELSRGHHDAWNILMPVLDPTQRYLRLDESNDSSTVSVADGVTFIATANIGNEYTSTRVMDKALTSRFPTIIEMEPLSYEGEIELLNVLYPKQTKEISNKFDIICKISSDTKKQCQIEDSRISTFIPTGIVEEMAEMVMDGFSLLDISETVIYPMYDKFGGVESERLYIKQMVQKYLDADASKVTTPINDPSNKDNTIPF